MKIVKILIASSLLLGATGCKKWFDVQPETQITATQLFSNEAGFRDALIGVYSSMTNTPESYTNDLSMAFLDVLAQTYDNVLPTQGHVYSYAAKYQYNSPSEVSRLSGIWSQLYNDIANANIILKNVDQKRSVFSGGNYYIVKGEALALRAYLHFDLLRLFAPSPVVGSSLPAIPYVDTVTTVARPQLTVDQTLARIIRDLDSARTYLAVADPYGPNHGRVDSADLVGMMGNRQNKMNYYAATGLLARVCLYRNDQADALTYANEVIQSGLFPLFTKIVNPGDNIFPTEHMFALPYEAMLTTYAQVYFPTIFNSQLPSAFALKNTILTQIYPASLNTDYRYTNWFQAAGSPYYVVTKYNQNDVVPLLKVSEMYLIAAESEPDVPTAITQYLNVFKAHRGITGMNAATTTQAQLLTEIGNEYRREFVAEGQLFYYYKRTNRQKLPTIAAFANSDSVYTLPIPQAEAEFGNVSPK